MEFLKQSLKIFSSRLPENRNAFFIWKCDVCSKIIDQHVESFVNDGKPKCCEDTSFVKVESRELIPSIGENNGN